MAYADERMDRMGPSVIEATASLCEVIDKRPNRPRRHAVTLNCRRLYRGASRGYLAIPREPTESFLFDAVSHVEHGCQLRENLQ